ncbi:hypothetical protein DFJ58DRAFT_745555 [Suillus subalutaceus]|uniref:uncharacterized protein n=1 Tax=Suillus subalutaceus TaxID=48586 RepID=UPI001B883AE2|nr:uncharacterized protein DFJ58DRAFT_745555 [Suillus subalutaceus]KAG1855200.1 hypothetical protein DFJ58DRAFT_745555 [Suillus subalutaceus]
MPQQPTSHSLNPPFDLHNFMSGLEESLYALDWNDIISVAIITLISYDYILQFEKEVTFVWGRRWSVMYISIPCCSIFWYCPCNVRRGGCILQMVRCILMLTSRICAIWGGLIYMPEAVSYDMFLFMKWSFSVYLCLTEVILIWRLYVLYNQSKLILYLLLGLFSPVVVLYIGVDIFLWSRPSAVSVEEIIITPTIKYCTTFYHIGPMPALYASVPVVCYDIFLVVLAIAVLRKHLKERKEFRMKPNTYVVMIVRYHAIYFVLNLASQIYLAISWANLSTVVLNLAILFKDTTPFIIAPRLIISIWDTHANDNCVHLSTMFEDCVCLSSPPELEQPEIDPCV